MARLRGLVRSPRAARASGSSAVPRLGLPSWLRRWGISIASLLLGLATLLVFRRGLPHVGWIVGDLLLLWLIVAVVTEVRVPVENRRRRLALQAAEYTIQTLYHNLLLFVLPAYYASATLTSVNALFLAGVAAGALVTAVDPWYRALVAPRPWLGHALLGFSVFAALNVALPLVSVRPIIALEGSAVLAALSLTPILRRPGAATWRQAHGRAAALALVAAVAVWLGRGVVPPAPLFLARATAAREVQRLEPVGETEGSIPAATVVGWGGIAAYTAVHAPAGLSQAIEHVWRRDGQVVARIPLSPVQGGRAEGFRTWSRRTDLAPPLHGRYTVDVMTASGQLIGRLRFTVTP
ncbi:MAG: DUF2914 domain-containing protein [Candidatus Rokubacteria bacterium]|nr:DUF2914 domain-containing protein [Candidatus Rokubacteria bacterium]